MNASRQLALATIVTLLCLIYRGVGGASHPRFRIDVILCSDDSFVTENLYGLNVYEVLEDLVDKTPNSSGKVYKNAYPRPSSAVYGYASCQEELSSSDCHICLVESLANLLGGCSKKRGAQIVFADCKLRYEPYQIDP